MDLQPETYSHGLLVNDLEPLTYTREVTAMDLSPWSITMHGVVLMVL
jgi:hypothetical protein